MWIKSDRVKLPEPVEHRTCELFVYNNGDPEKNPQSFARVIQQVVAAEIDTLPPEQQDVRGFPSIFAIIPHMEHPVLMVWPQPDKPYFAEFRFHPPMKRI